MSTITAADGTGLHDTVVQRRLSAGDLYATPWTYDVLATFVEARSPLTGFDSSIDWSDLGRRSVTGEPLLIPELAEV